MHKHKQPQGFIAVDFSLPVKYRTFVYFILCVLLRVDFHPQHLFHKAATEYLHQFSTVKQYRRVFLVNLF